jgi:hypothetical protein
MTTASRIFACRSLDVTLEGQDQLKRLVTSILAIVALALSVNAASAQRRAVAQLVYEPFAIVRHRHRRSYEALKTQLTNNGIGFYAYLVRSAQAYPDERAGILRLGAWWLYYWNLRRLGRKR